MGQSREMCHPVNCPNRNNTDVNRCQQMSRDQDTSSECMCSDRSDGASNMCPHPRDQASSNECLCSDKTNENDIAAEKEYDNCRKNKRTCSLGMTSVSEISANNTSSENRTLETEHCAYYECNETEKTLSENIKTVKCNTAHKQDAYGDNGHDQTVSKPDEQLSRSVNQNVLKSPRAKRTKHYKAYLRRECNMLKIYFNKGYLKLWKKIKHFDMYLHNVYPKLRKSFKTFDILYPRVVHKILCKTGIFELRSECINNQSVNVYPVISSLYGYLSRDQSEGSEEMCYEVRRLQSYSSVTIRASPMRLSQSGFYATGNEDKTRCYSCNRTHRNWRMMDHPDQIHRSMSPDCPHLNRRDQRNIPISPSVGNDVNCVFGFTGEYPLSNGFPESSTPQSIPAVPTTPCSEETTATTSLSDTTLASATPEEPSVPDLDISSAVYPQYRDLTSRLDSYRGWEWSHVQDPQVLASAGFYYAGYRDCVRCFYCGVGLRTWERLDDPWVEHVRWRSSCDYIRAMKGEHFAIQALARHDPLVPPVTPVTTQTQTNQRASVTENDTDAIQKAVEMGFPRSEIERAVVELARPQGASETVRQTDTIQLEALLEKLILMGEQTSTTQASVPNSVNPPRNVPGARDQIQSSVDTTVQGATGGVDTGSLDTMASSKTESHTGSAAISSPIAHASYGDTSGAASVTSQKTVDTENSDGSSKGSKKAKRKRKNKHGGDHVSEKENEHSTDSETEVLTVNQERQLEEENQSLRDENTCKICLDNPSCIVFLPCGHLVTCAECAPALRKCPICRAFIRGTVRAHTVSSGTV